MKKLSFAIVFLGCVLTGKGQTNPKVSDTSRSIMPMPFRSEILEKARYSHTTSKGKIYIMPYDNMPCLVPDMKGTRMPGTTPPLQDMPNATPKQELIPKEKDK